MGNTVTVSITVDRGEAIRASKGVWGHQTTTIALEGLTDEQRDALAKSSLDQGNRIDLKKHGSVVSTWNKGYPKISEATPETALLVLNHTVTYLAERERQEEEQKARAAEQLDKSIAQAVEKLEAWLTEEYDVDASYTAPQKPHIYDAAPLKERHPELVARVEAEHAQRMKAYEDRQERLKVRLEEDRKRKESEKARLAQAKQSFFAKWVEEIGTASQKARHARGYLSEEEILNNMRDRVFSGLNKFPRYRRMKDRDLVHSEYCDELSGEYSVEVAPDLDEDEFSWLVEIEGVIENTVKHIVEGHGFSPVEKEGIDFEAKLFGYAYEVEARRHEGYCENCKDHYDSEVLRRLGFLVTVQMGPFTFSREYGMGPE